MIKRNTEIRTAAKFASVFLYEIAEKLNVSEPTFNRWLRKELSDGMKTKILAAIGQIQLAQEAEQDSN